MCRIMALTVLHVPDSCLDCLICAGLQVQEVLRPPALWIPQVSSLLFGTRNGSRTCLVQTIGRAGTNIGRDRSRQVQEMLRPPALWIPQVPTLPAILWRFISRCFGFFPPTLWSTRGSLTPYSEVLRDQIRPSS